jgi:hypothetical protein
VSAFEGALRARDVSAIAETARQLDTAAEQQAALLRRWPRKIEGPLEAVKTLCGQLGAFWEFCAADSVRALKARRREFVIVVLDTAEIRHPQPKRYQTLDAWIDLRP